LAKQPQKTTKALNTKPNSPSKAEQNAAYAQAKQAIQTVSETHAVALDLSGKDFQNLTTLPQQIKALRQLTQLDLSDTQVSDLLPLVPLTQFEKRSF